MVGFVLLDPDFSAERACRDRLIEYANDNINGFTRRCLEINDL